MKTLIHNTMLLSLLTLILSTQAMSGTFEGLTPGESCRGEVYGALGQPIRQADKGLTCYFNAKPFKGKMVKVSFDISGMIRTIVLEPDTPYSKEQYENWLDLGQPSRQKEKDGNRYNYYNKKGMALVQDGLGPEALVTYFWHYRTDYSALKKVWTELEDRFHESRETNDCAGMKTAYLTGQKKFPKIAWFYVDEISWRIACTPKSKLNPHQLVRLAQKGVDLNPVDESYKFLGYAHVSMTKDPEKALAAFSHINPADDPSIHVYMGGCQQELGNTAKAKKHYQSYLNALPNGKQAAIAKRALKQLSYL